MDISGNALNKTRNLEKSNIIRYVLLCAVIAVSFFAIGPRAFSSEWVSSSDFHACIEIAGSFIAIIAAIACLIFMLAVAIIVAILMEKNLTPPNKITREAIAFSCIAIVLGKLEDYWFVICKRVSKEQLQWAQNR